MTDIDEMHDVDRLIDALIAREGGYVNDPADAGGETNFGITARVARQHGYEGPMRALPRDEAARIYKRIYWLAPHFDQVAEVYPRAAAELFDTGVNMGPKTAVTFLQRALNAFGLGKVLKVDGDLGDSTRTALGLFYGQRAREGEEVLLRLLDALQGEKYLRIVENNPTQSRFLFGWIAKRLGNA